MQFCDNIKYASFTTDYRDRCSKGWRHSSWFICLFNSPFMQFLTPNVQYRLKHGKSGHYTLHYTVQRNKRAKHLMFSKSVRFCPNIYKFIGPLLLPPPPPHRQTWFNWELTCQPARPISANITRLDEIIYTAPYTRTPTWNAILPRAKSARRKH